MNCGCRWKWRMIIAGQKKPGKIRASTGLEAVTSAIQVRCSTNWAMKPHIGSGINLSPVRSGMMWIMYEIIHLWTAVVDESEVKASSFQLLKLENLLRWSLFTLIYNRSSNIWIISYIFHIISLFTGDINSMNWCCSQCPMKPDIGSKVNLLSSYLPWGVKWDNSYVWAASCR